MLERASLLSGVLVAILFLPFLAQAELRFGPYLQSMAPDSVSVCAFVEEGDEVRVRFLIPDGAAREVDAVGHAPAVARLTGLLPEVEYRYELFVGGHRVTGDDPPGFVARSDVMQTFVIFGDTRSGEDSLSLAHDQVVQAIRENAVPDAIFHTGDFVEDGESLELWESFFRIESDLLATAPIFPAIGQSDQPARVMRGLFSVLAEKPWYSVDRGDAPGAVLNLWQARSQGPDDTAADGAQATWLRKDLAAARARGVRYIFVMLHEPAIDLEGRSSKAVREVYIPIFEAFDVTAVFSGAHYFSHAVRNGVHYFTNGGGGAALDTRAPGEGVFRFFRATHHFLVLEVDRFGARASAVDPYGGSFYWAAFGDVSTAAQDAGAPTFVESFPAGTKSVAMTVYFLPGCGACDAFKAGLWNRALRTGSSLEVTFRSAEDPDNRALLSALTDSGGPVPIVAVGERVMVGTEEIARGLDAAIGEATALPAPEGSADGRWIVALVSLVAGSILLGALHSLRKS